MGVPHSPPRRTARHWSDWAGFAAFSLVWVSVLRSTPALGLMTLPLMLHPLLSSAGFLLRRPARECIAGFAPRFAAYSGSFGIAAFFVFATHFHPQWIAVAAEPWLRSVGGWLWLLGCALDGCILWYLRHAMSIVPQARTLITAGPYRFARHPLYAAYIVQSAGIWLRYETLALALAYGAWLALTVARIRYEERVLAANFPEYASYRERVGMFCPRWWRRAACPAKVSSTARMADN